MILRFHRNVYGKWLSPKQQTTWDAVARYEFFESATGGGRKPIYMLIVGRQAHGSK